MKNRLITCVLACLMIFLVGCNGNTAKEAAQEITKTETSFPAGNTETHSQEETEKSAVREKATITADESQSTAESQTVVTVQTKPVEEKSADMSGDEKVRTIQSKELWLAEDMTFYVVSCMSTITMDKEEAICLNEHRSVVTTVECEDDIFFDMGSLICELDDICLFELLADVDATIYEL